MPKSSRPWITLLIVTLVFGMFIAGSTLSSGQVRTLPIKVVSITPAVHNDRITYSFEVTPTLNPHTETPADLIKITSRDHISGASDAAVAVIEYADLECPFCKMFHPIMQQLMSTSGQQILWVFRHFPLASHTNALKEAEASECAYEQKGNDGFWNYINALYTRTLSNGDGFSLDNLAPLAGSLGFEAVAFQECLDSGKFAQYIDEQKSGGETLGIHGTPTSVIVNLKTKKFQLMPGALQVNEVLTTIHSVLQ